MWINSSATVSFNHNWPCAQSSLTIRHSGKHHSRLLWIDLSSSECTEFTNKQLSLWKSSIWYCLKLHRRPGRRGNSVAGAVWRNKNPISHSCIWMCHMVPSNKIYRHHNAPRMMHDAVGVGSLSGCSCWERGAEELIIHHATVGKLINIYAPIGSSANGRCRWRSLCTGSTFSS